jgi:hypothetical protein
MPENFGKILASWRVPEFEKHQRSIIWYLGFGLLGTVLLVYAFWTMNFLFALIILIAAFVVYIQEKTEPGQVKFLISAKGIKIGKKFHSYKDINKFWILYNPPEVKKLYFTFNNMLSFRLMLPLKNQNPLKIRDILLQFLEEDLEKEEEPLSEAVGRWAKI